MSAASSSTPGASCARTPARPPPRCTTTTTPPPTTPASASPILAGTRSREAHFVTAAEPPNGLRVRPTTCRTSLPHDLHLCDSGRRFAGVHPEDAGQPGRARDPARAVHRPGREPGARDLYLDPEGFREAFASDVDSATTAVTAAT